MRYLLLLVVLCLGAFNIFYNVSGQPLAEWDESRHVVSAVEMVESQDFIVTRYMGKPDYWNVKPPLAVWGGALGYGLMEDKFVGVRLFSLVTSAVLALAVFIYACRVAGVYAGLLASLLLLTVPSMVLKHGMRSADADMLLICAITLGMLAFSVNRRWFVALGYVALGFAFLAKSFHVMPYGVVAFVYTVYLCRQRLLSLYDVILLPIFFLLPILPWALARYQADGLHFFDVMFFYDVVKRSTQAIEGNEYSSFIYIMKVLSAFMAPVFCMAFIAATQKTRHVFKSVSMVLPLLWFFIPLFVYTLAKTRLGWYAYPLFPAVAIMAGIAFVRAAEFLTRKQCKVMAAVVVLGLVVNEARIVRQILHPPGDAVQKALLTLSEKNKPAVISVYLEPDTDLWRQYDDATGLWRQHHYATALLLGNIRLQHGGRAAFTGQSAAAYLISDGGKITRRLPGE